MGGAVATTVRRENGEVIKMCRKTGSEGRVFLNKSFLSGDFDKAIDDYLVNWNEMREDYLAQQKSEPAKFLMSDFYAPHASLIPAGYGLNVIDFQKKKIYTCQDYNSPGIFYVYDLLNGLKDKDEYPVWDEIISSGLKCVGNCDQPDQALMSISEALGSNNTSAVAQLAAFLYGHKYMEAQKFLFGDKEIQPIPAFEFEHHMDVTFQIAQSSGFEFVRYEKNYPGYRQFFQDLIDGGFKITDEELKGWVDFCIEDYAEDEEEENPISAEQIRTELYAMANKPIPTKSLAP